MKLFSVVMELQQWVQRTLLLSYKYFVMFLKIKSIKYYGCVSVVLPSLSGMPITSLLRVISMALEFYIFSLISRNREDFWRKNINIRFVF